MHKQVKPRGPRLLRLAGALLGGALCLTLFSHQCAAANAVTTRRVSAASLGLRPGKPVFGLAVYSIVGAARVAEIFAGSPADRAGLHPGDTLLSGDDTLLQDKPKPWLLSFLAGRDAMTFRVRSEDGAERTVRLTKAAPETFADVQQMVTVHRAELGLAGAVVGQRPPDFAANAGEGNVRLTELRGRPVVVIFWATWCLPCLAEGPTLRKLYAEFQPRGVEFLGVSLDDDRARVDRALAEQKIPWPQNFDGRGQDNEAAQKYGVSSIPALVLIGKDGRVLANRIPLAELRAALEKALR